MLIETKRTYDVADLDPMEAYKLGTGLTVPRPIGWIGSVSESGVRNLAPYSFFNMVAKSPLSFIVAPASNMRKDTLDNLQATGVFTINVVTEETVVAMNASAASFPADVDEFEECGLTAVRAETSEAPIVAEAVANLECRVVQIIPVGKSPDGLEPSSMLVIGESQRIHVAERVSDDNFHIDPHELHAVGRLAGGWYSRTSDALFQLDRPS
ncbi:MAG: flavin reductase family protein [Acidimicrobiia bacterium]|nr:flavin reductase family protein [Acidimicrobiia bacterium]